MKIGKKVAEKLKGTTETRKQEELLGVIINILIVCIEQGAYDETGYFVQAAENIRTSTLTIKKSMWLNANGQSKISTF